MRKKGATAPPDEVRPLLSLPQVAERLGVNAQTLRRLAKRGEFIPPVLVGSTRRYRQEDLDAYIRDRTAAGS